MQINSSSPNEPISLEKPPAFATIKEAVGLMLSKLLHTIVLLYRAKASKIIGATIKWLPWCCMTSMTTEFTARASLKTTSYYVSKIHAGNQPIFRIWPTFCCSTRLIGKWKRRQQCGFSFFRRRKKANFLLLQAATFANRTKGSYCSSTEEKLLGLL